MNYRSRLSTQRWSKRKHWPNWSQGIFFKANRKVILIVHLSKQPNYSETCASVHNAATAKLKYSVINPLLCITQYTFSHLLYVGT